MTSHCPGRKTGVGGGIPAKVGMTSLAKVNLWARFQNTENYRIKLYNTSKTNYQKQEWVQGAEEIEYYVYKACTPSQFDVAEDKRSAPA